MNTELNYIRVPSSDFFEIKQRIGSFFVCKMTPKQLKRIAKKDINRYEDNDEIQRELRKSRIDEIHEFIYGKEYATFPNSFIISVSDDSYISEGALNIVDREDEAYILDGQHRLSGFDAAEESFEIIVSVYIGLNKFYQAMIFANINGEQVKVNKSLVRSLYGFSDKRTPEMVTYSIIKLLNEQETSPWKNGIKMLGRGNGILSLATFFDSLIFEIGGDKEKGKYSFKGTLSRFYLHDGEDFSFTKDDSVIYYLLEDYFNSVKNEFNEEWLSPDYILNKTTGFYAFFWVFIDILTYSYSKDIPINKLNKDYFGEFLSGLKRKINPLVNDNYKAGGVGQNNLYNDIRNNLAINIL